MRGSLCLHKSIIDMRLKTCTDVIHSRTTGGVLWEDTFQRVLHTLKLLVFADLSYYHYNTHKPENQYTQELVLQFLYESFDSDFLHDADVLNYLADGLMATLREIRSYALVLLRELTVNNEIVNDVEIYSPSQALGKDVYTLIIETGKESVSL